MHETYHLTMNPQSALICLICESTLKRPMFLPCLCNVCKKHVKDLYIESNRISIRCQLCCKVSKANELKSNVLAGSFIRKYKDKLAQEEFLTSLENSMTKLEPNEKILPRSYAIFNYAVTNSNLRSTRWTCAVNNSNSKSTTRLIN